MAQSCISIILVLQLCLIPGIKSQQWNINISRWYVCAVTGSSVVLPCSFTHPPDVTITKVFWVIDPVKGQESPDMSKTSEYKGRVRYSTDTGKNCTLILEQVKPTDAHKYHARITSPETAKRWLSIGVKLRVGDLSVQIHEPVIEGQDAELSCNSSCSLTGKPNLVWRRNGNVLPGKQTDKNNKNLLIKRIRIEDEGQYSCELQDGVGHPSKPVKLNVMFSPRNTTLSIMPSSAILKGNSVTLTCSSEANPPVENYTWFKVDESTPVGSGQQYGITNISSEDVGQYYCQAGNRYGAGNSSAVLITVEEDKARMIYVVIGVSSGCGLLGLSCLAYFIWRQCRAGTPKDTSQLNMDSGTNNTNASKDMDPVYQNIKPSAYANDDDIYQNV